MTTNKPKSRRVYYEVRKVTKKEAAADPQLLKWQITRDKERIDTKETKREAVEMATITAECAWERCGQMSELTIKLFNGKIEDKRTYPRSSDPRGSKG